MKNTNNLLKVGIFLTWDYSLKTWEDSGTLEREIKLFKKLHEDKNIKFTFYSYGNNDDLKFRNKFDFINVIPLYRNWRPTSRFVRFLYSLLIPIRFSKQLGNLDILYQNQLLGAWVPIFIKYLKRKPLIIRTGYDMLEFAINDSKSRSLINLYKILTYISVIASDTYTVSNHSDLKRFEYRYPKQKNKFLLRPNWVDILKSENISIRKVNKILTVGRIVQQKNFSFLISEFSNTKEKFSIDIVGEGPQKETLEKLALQRNVQINFLGRVNHSELLSLYKEYKFFISTSYYEGNPKTLLEAMAAGCVVFASDISNHRELITNSNDGFLFQFDKGSLMSKFNDYSSKDLELTKISRNAIQKVTKNNSLDNLVENTFNDLVNLETSNPR